MTDVIALATDGFLTSGGSGGFVPIITPVSRLSVGVSPGVSVSFVKGCVSVGVKSRKLAVDFEGKPVALFGGR